ncbi:MAG: GMC family oxidoreductase [Verrucomicrobiae bacterium]|nr:GMC family oxidoreductase [Verrucomicrobiae bacterium]MDW7980349.1 GMC family oxidoreductase [Verrucomicrobiales bacterium]
MTRPGWFWFHDTVSAIAYSAARQLVPAQGPEELGPPYNDVARFILREHERMADYLRFPLQIVTLAFDIAALPSARQMFHRLPPAERQRLIARWKSARLGPMRDLIRFYESLAAIALFERGTTAHGQARTYGAQTHIQNVIETPPDTIRSEIVVIGSGPAGAITATLLAEHGRNVLLLEEGPYLPLESCPPFSQLEMEQKYRNGGLTVALGKTKIAYVEACCAGGGSEINSGLYHRTPADVLDQWRREFQVEGLMEHELTPQFEACEKELSVSGLVGPAPPASLKLEAGAVRLGWRAIEVPRWFKPEPTPSAPWHGTRQSMTKTYLPRFFAAGGALLPRTRAVRLRLEGNKWLILCKHAARRHLRIEAETVFVCCGAIQTPALLRRSGIKQNIGNTLCLHPTIKVVAEFPEPVNARDMGVPVHQVKEFAPRFSFGCSISTPAYIALGLLDYPEQVARVHKTWQQMANYYAMIVPEGRGTVRPVPGFRDPLVRYELTQRDYATLAEALRRLCELLLAAGAVAVYPSLAGLAPVKSVADLRSLPDMLPARLVSLMTIHLFSSCPMGENRALCGANSFGRVHGFKNLFINDASLLCSAPGVNPQGTIMALARRNTLKFLGKL